MKFQKTYISVLGFNFHLNILYYGQENTVCVEHGSGIMVGGSEKKELVNWVQIPADFVLFISS